MASHAAVFLLSFLVASTLATALQEAAIEAETSFLQHEFQTKALAGVAHGIALDDSASTPTCKAPVGPLYEPQSGDCMPSQPQKKAAQPTATSRVAAKADSSDDSLNFFLRCCLNVLIVAAGVGTSMAVKRCFHDAIEDDEEEEEAKPNQEEQTRLMIAAVQAGDEKALQSVIDNGAKVDKLVDAWGHTVLHLAATEGSLSVVRVLVDAGAFVDAQDGAEESPLHAAARAGHTEICELLLARGATVGLPGVMDEDIPMLLTSLVAKHVIEGGEPNGVEVPTSASESEEQ